MDLIEQGLCMLGRTGLPGLLRELRSFSVRSQTGDQGFARVLPGKKATKRDA